MEKTFQFVTALLAGAVQFLYGDWTILLTILLVLAILDFISGMAAGFVEGNLKSKVGMIGIARKVFIFVMVAVAHLIDLLLIESGLETKALVMTMVIVFYAVNEILSITENAGRIGLPVPEQIKSAIVVLKGKDDRK
ncbi:phage holin family protein [Cytobacillus solani]|uniref:Holin n=1 Tax=Cytobacillus solani TaxID=1637975 RepID=A0A0Q3QJD3_9BACI|nr:phage holin family protein [Cytobacillus solani]KQL17694.1 holin [Cytobacillus solani]